MGHYKSTGILNGPAASLPGFELTVVLTGTVMKLNILFVYKTR